jgi:hypothetical protein
VAAGNAPVGGGGSCNTTTEPDGTQGVQQAYDNGLYTCSSSAWVAEALILGSALQDGTTAACNATNTGMIEWNGSAFQGCNGTSWASLGGGGSSTITLGTSAATTNPQRSGQADTGLFSATSATVSVAVDISGTGTDEADFASTGLNLPVATESYRIGGNNAVWQDTTNFNVAVGKTAMPTTLSQTGGGNNGAYDVAVGIQALNANTTGGTNTGLGAQALFQNTIGASNTAVGAQALYSNSTGNQNTALGTSALLDNSPVVPTLQSGMERLAAILGVATILLLVISL